MEYTVEEVLETILAREINKELNKDIVGHVLHGQPLQSTPAKFEFPDNWTQEQINEWHRKDKEYHNEILSRRIGEEDDGIYCK